jgi:tyrosine decarboxylase
MAPHPRDALRAWFLGPRAENAELLERLVVESLRDHVFWRRNYHPEDGFAIREQDKRQEGYEENVATLTQELMGCWPSSSATSPSSAGATRGT